MSLIVSFRQFPHFQFQFHIYVITIHGSDGNRRLHIAKSMCVMALYLFNLIKCVIYHTFTDKIYQGTSIHYYFVHENFQELSRLISFFVCLGLLSLIENILFILVD